MPDAVVIGAGPNGLVAANMLVDRGWDVVVLEAAPTPGGAVRSESLMEPRFVNDVFSAFYPLGFASPAIRALGLEEFGLTWRRAPLVLAHPAPDDTCPIISTDIDETACALDALHPGDGDAWRRLFERWTRVRDGLLDALFTPIPPVRASARLALATRHDGLLRFARFALLSARRLVTEEFASEGARRLFAATALHADLSPEDSLSGFFGWILCSLGQEVGWPVPEGGAGRLTDALVTRLQTKGGRVECNVPVERVVVRDGRAVAVVARGDEVAVTRAVLADVDAPRLYRSLVGPEHLPARVLDALARFTWDHAVAKIDWNLDAPVPWRATAARRAGTVHLVDSLDALTETRAQIARGVVPERPFLLLGQQSMTDPSRMPNGCETLWAYTHLPRGLQFDHDAKERLADRMQGCIEELAPGFAATIRARHVMAPADLEARNANLVGGAIGGGTGQLYQQLVFRPIPGWGRAETPVRGLYLASASAHPGGGVHGACGANAARAALWHDRLRFRRG
ncbi:MAG TPA: NAD(P)/FAD-dependent oxidoreductase [Acidimicrobiia bacterium]|nr:NAD(P)/FAD-dependent oxidoreductase [Acidimicrobiia bacterium]